MILSAGYIPANGTFLERTVGTKVADGTPTLSLESLKNSKVERQEARLVLDYASKYLRDAGLPKDIAPSGAPLLKVSDLALGRAMFDLLTAPIDRSTPQGRDRELLRSQLGLRTEIDRKTLSYLQRCYGAHHLAGAHVIYNGHTTAATMSLFPMLQALGLSSGGYRRSAYSGDKGAAPLLNTILTGLMGTSDRDFNLGAQTPARVIEELMTPGTVIAVNAGPMLAGMDIPQEVRDRIKRGDIRFVIHNAADMAAMAKLDLEGAVCLNLAISEPKEIEVRVIGEQLVFHGDQGSRTYNQAPIRDATSIVIGHGMIGQSITKALLARNISRDNIVIIDPDTDGKARAVARERGLTRIYGEIPAELANVESGVVFVATNCGEGVGARDVRNLPKSTVILNANSGGIGIDADGIASLYKNGQLCQGYEGAHGLIAEEHGSFADMVASRLPDDGKDRPEYLTILNARIDKKDSVMRVYAPNLTDTHGQEKLVTASMLGAAVCALMSVSKPPLDGRLAHDFPKEDADAIRIATMVLQYDDMIF